MISLRTLGFFVLSCVVRPRELCVQYLHCSHLILPKTSS